VLIEEDWKLSWFLVLLITCSACSALSQLTFLNLAMKNFNQLQVAPSFQSFLIMMQLMVGLIILRENDFYSGT
jgi:hypothetical protein